MTIDINETLRLAISSEQSPPDGLAVLSWLCAALSGAREDWDQGAGENWARVFINQRVVAFVNMRRPVVVVAAEARSVVPELRVKGVPTIMVPNMDTPVLRADRDLIANLADRQISEVLNEAQFSAEDLVWATV